MYKKAPSDFKATELSQTINFVIFGQLKNYDRTNHTRTHQSF